MSTALVGIEGPILLWFQNVLRQDWLDPMVAFFTHLGDSGAVWIALCILLLCFKGTRKAGVCGAVALLLSLCFTNLLIKPLLRRTRPWLMVEGLLALVDEHDPNSFPSGHTSAAFAAASAWYRALDGKRLKVAALAVAALMGLSRLYAGVHFPSDVICGALVGLLCGWLAWQLVESFELKKKEKRAP